MTAPAAAPPPPKRPRACVRASSASLGESREISISRLEGCARAHVGDADRSCSQQQVRRDAVHSWTARHGSAHLFTATGEKRRCSQLDGAARVGPPVHSNR